MRTLLFAPITMDLAEVTRMIEVARAATGFRAVFMGYEDDWAHLITDAGFDYRPCQPAWTEREKRLALALDQGRTLRNPFSAGLVERRVRLERDLIAQTQAAAVVTGTNLTSFISARAEGVPLFYPVPFALTVPHVRQTSRLGVVSGRGRLRRIADRAASWVFRQAYTRLPLAPRAFATVARRHGVRLGNSLASLLTADHNLLTVLPDELSGYELPSGYERVGPVYARLGGDVPAQVRELAARRPLVYLGLGSSANRNMALAAARTLGAMDVDVIAPISHYVASSPLPPNVHVTGPLPAHLLGGLVDAAVIHGGQGTVQTACATGVPFVGMGLQPEQAWNVEVCVRRGNALALSPRQAGTRALAGAVTRILHEDRFHDAAATVQAAFAREDGPAACVAAIQRELATA